MHQVCFSLGSCFRAGHHPSQTPRRHSCLLQHAHSHHFSALRSRLAPLSVPNATSSVPATTTSGLHYRSCLLTRFSSPLLLLPPQIHFLSYNHTELSNTLSHPGTPLFTALQWLPSLSETRTRQIMIGPRLPSPSSPCSSPTPDTQNFSVGISHAPAGLLHAIALLQGKTSMLPSFICLANYFSPLRISLPPGRLPDCHSTPQFGSVPLLSAPMAPVLITSDI